MILCFWIYTDRTKGYLYPYGGLEQTKNQTLLVITATHIKPVQHTVLNIAMAPRTPWGHCQGRAEL